MLTSELRIFLAFLVANFSALYVIPKIASIARAIGLVDMPNRRKVHTEPRPLVGGIGMVIAATFSSLLLIPLAGYRGFFLGLAVLLLVGFLDDFRELGHRQKFLAQIGASVLIMYFCKAYLLSFGDLVGFGPLDLPDIKVVVWLVTIFCVVGVINSVNLMDGLDGLAGGVSFIAFLAFALHASFAGESVLMLLNLAFAGAVLGFLRYNWYPASVFMGDAGSLSLGFTLAFMAIVMTQGDTAVISPVCPLLILAVPITDTITVMSKRIVRGRNPFKADQHHLHHLLMRCGMNRKTAVKVILTICVVMSGITLLVPFYTIPDYVFFTIFCLYFIGYAISSFFVVYIIRFSLRHIRRRAHEVKQAPMATIAHSLLGNIDLLKVFRKDNRYPVQLEMTCRVKESGKTFSGRILNISDSGCMASIPDLTTLQDTVINVFTFPMDHDVYTITLRAEHLWISETDNDCLHGFRFQEVDLDGQTVFKKFVTRFNMHTKHSGA